MEKLTIKSGCPRIKNCLSETGTYVNCLDTVHFSGQSLNVQTCNSLGYGQSPYQDGGGIKPGRSALKCTHVLNTWQCRDE